jgi:hypothetical protein
MTISLKVELIKNNDCSGYDRKILQPIYELTEHGRVSATYMNAKFEDCNVALVAPIPLDILDSC